MATSIIKKLDDKVLGLYASVGNTIYHYTSPSGLKGILDEQPSLYFTRYDCLNDFTEGKIVPRIYKSVLANYQSEHTDARDFCQMIQNVEPSNTTYIPLSGNIPGSHKNDETNSCYVNRIECTPYICCFSMEPDSLPMWTYYSKERMYEGYNIEIFKDRIFDYKYLFRHFPVIYNSQVQEKRIHDLTDQEYINFSKYDNNIELIRLRLSNYLLELSLQFKNCAFEHEKEYRYILFMPDDLPKQSLDYAIKMEDWLKVKYRVGNGIFIPYVEVPINAESIVKITVGPFYLKEMAEETMKQYLQNREEYRSVNVEPSGIPLRF